MRSPSCDHSQFTVFAIGDGTPERRPKNYAAMRGVMYYVVAMDTEGRAPKRISGWVKVHDDGAEMLAEAGSRDPVMTTGDWAYTFNRFKGGIVFTFTKPGISSSYELTVVE